MSTELKRELGFWDLVLFHVTAIIGLRWLAVAAAIGYSSVSLWGLAFVGFFLPQAYVLMKLTRKWPVEGGLYEWTKMATGPFHGFLSGWCYWVNNITYYPALMTTAAGFATYIFGGSRALEANKVYIVTFSLVGFWIVVILNLVGMKIGKWVTNTGAVSTWIAAGLSIILGTLYLFKSGNASPFEAHKLVPAASLDNFSTWALMCFAMAGFELVSLMGGEIKEPERNIPRSIVFGGVIATVIYIIGTLSLIVSVPYQKISQISGILQALMEQTHEFGASFLVPLVAIVLVISQCGGVAAWLAGSNRAMMMAGVDNYVPKAFAKIHPRWGTPYVSIIVQAILSSAIVLMSAAGSTVEQFYRLLLDYNLIIYFIPYLYLFISYFLFMRKREMPMTAGGVISSIVGFLTTLIAIALSFIPAGVKNEAVPISILGWNFSMTDSALYEVKLIVVFVGMIGIGILLYVRAMRRNKAAVK